MTATAFAVAGALSVPALAATPNASGTDSSSSTSNYDGYFNVNDLVGNSFLAAPAANASAAAQYGGYGNRYPNYQNRWSHLAFEAGGGATAPVGNDVRDGYDTWGYNFNVGAGWNFSKRIGALIEWQFNNNKIPGSTLAALSNESGIYPLYGNIHTWGFSVDPILYQPITHTVGAYITGGGGFYRKVTTFSTPVLGEQCYYFCYEGYFPQTVAHSSSNQGGLNLGIGLYWKAFGQDSNAKLFAEARYLWVNSPGASNSDPYGSGTEGIIPITFGLRF